MSYHLSMLPLPGVLPPVLGTTPSSHCSEDSWEGEFNAYYVLRACVSSFSVSGPTKLEERGLTELGFNFFKYEYICTICHISANLERPSNHLIILLFLRLTWLIIYADYNFSYITYKCVFSSSIVKSLTCITVEAQDVQHDGLYYFNFKKQRPTFLLFLVFLYSFPWDIWWQHEETTADGKKLPLKWAIKTSLRTLNLFSAPLSGG